ncbi:MAG TPA: conjugal transfer protein TraY [Xanthomonadales bacterium]|nr:conjugal transfer protein TraY [Xanthomonadales bacterium]
MYTALGERWIEPSDRLSSGGGGCRKRRRRHGAGGVDGNSLVGETGFEPATSTPQITVQTRTSYVKSWVPTNEIASVGSSSLGWLTGTGYKPVQIPVTNFAWEATGGYVNPAVCGGLRWEESPQSQEGNARYLDLSGIAQVHGQAVNTMIQTLRPVAERIVAGEKPDGGAIAQAAYAYERELQQAARAAVDASNEASRSAFVDFAQTGGWVHAGAYYNHIIQINDAVQLAVNSMPSSQSIDIDRKETETSLIGYRDSMMAAEEYLLQRGDAASQAYEAEMRADTEDCGFPRTWDALKRCLSKPAVLGIEQMTQQMAGGNTSHVAQVKGIGDGIMATAWGFVGTMIGVRLITAEADGLTLGAAKGPNEVMSMLTGIITVFFFAMISAGATMAFYVPMIPFIAWITGVIKWVVSVAETLIAAPIWAAAHIHPDGDDAVGRAGPGYMIILSMILRPVLMTFGLMASIAVAQPIAHLVNGGFMLAVKGAMHDSANGLGAFVAFCIIYAIIMTVVLHAVFGLINYIPDKVLRFMGAAVDMHGVADSEAHESQRVFAAAAIHGNRAVASAAGPALHGGDGGGSSPPRQRGSGSTRPEDHVQNAIRAPEE